ncbi:MAG: DUF1501 domain-containing protein, partial [Acidobacteria bacterium]|nr:DUF1501 domain-containing protein [Acidobacteriota bacterium]
MAKDECPNACPGHESFLFRGEGFSRRHMFRLAGTTIAGTWFSRVLNPPELAAAVSPSLRGTAKNCVFVFLGGAPSHVDTFDLKEGSWTPADFAPTSYAGVRFPQGLLPKTAEQLGKIAIVRPALAWAAVHSLGTTWAQIARNPSGALGKLAPHIGAVVSLESERTRKPTDILPGFLSLNGGTAGAGYMPSRYAPFAVGTPSASGLASLAHPDPARFQDRWKLIHDLDETRAEGTLGKPTTDYDDFYDQAKALMDSPDAAKIFQFTAEDRAKYGTTGFGDSLLVARNVLA